MKRGFACAPRLVIVSLIESVTSSTPWLTVSITCSPRWLTVSVTASVTPSTPLPTASTATLTDSNTASFTSPTALAICGGERTKRLKGGSNVRPIGHSVKADTERVVHGKQMPGLLTIARKLALENCRLLLLIKGYLACLNHIQLPPTIFAGIRQACVHKASKIQSCHSGHFGDLYGFLS